MRQLVEEITLGRPPIESALAQYHVLTRQTATQWVERVWQQELALTPALKGYSSSRTS